MLFIQLRHLMVSAVVLLCMSACVFHDETLKNVDVVTGDTIQSNGTRRLFLAQERQKTNINRDWQYHQGDIKPQSLAFAFSDSAGEGASIQNNLWQNVNLPHSYQLTSLNLDDSTDDKQQETFHRDISWYRKSIKANVKSGKRVYLEFEGAHQKTDLWVNGKHVGQHAISAYTPFHFDITDYIKNNRDNHIVLRLDNRKDADIPPDGDSRDYVLFGGLYRDVYWVVKDELQIGFPWESQQSGISITTPSVSESSATISVRSEIKNLSGKNKQFKLVTRILDANNHLVLKLSKDASLKPDSSVTLKQTASIDENVRLWSTDDPYLYRVNSQLISEGVLLESIDNPLGLRWIEHRLGQGVLLNGKPIELIGANRHQQYPYIGDALPNNLHRSDAIKFKQAGMNIVRLAHYPHDNAFVEACDELGILIAEEPPSWIEFGSDIWMDRLEESLRRMIRNHRNHPSIWGWGAGINHRGPLKRLHNAAKEEDPTRVTMNNGTVWTGPQHSGVTDIYAVMDYRGAKRAKNELLFAMEHTSTDNTQLLQQMVSRYKGDANLIGLASWSAHDSHSFMKRDKQYPNLSRWKASSWDSFRSPKPAFYWYQSELTRPAMVHIADNRAQKPGNVLIFTNTDSVEVFHNGQSLGKQKPTYSKDNQFLNSPSILFPFDWRNGELLVKGYRNGQLVAEHKRVKGAIAKRLDIVWDLDGFDHYADGSSIVVAFARITDDNGNVLDDAQANVKFDVFGPAQIIGGAEIGANPVKSENGIAPILIRVGKTHGTIKLTATSLGLDTAEAVLETFPQLADAKQNSLRPIIEPLRLRVDIGNAKQHIQEQWQAFNVDAAVSTTMAFYLDNEFKPQVTIEAIQDQLSSDNTWGVPGDLSFMIEDGVSVQANNAMTLSFSQLPTGNYQLKTWHHILSGNKELAPKLNFAEISNNQPTPRLTGFQPTFGRKVEVTEAGGGGRGDGGSNKGAAGFALHDVVVDDSGRFTLHISTQDKQGKIKLTGFDLQQMIND